MMLDAVSAWFKMVLSLLALVAAVLATMHRESTFCTAAFWYVCAVSEWWGWLIFRWIMKNADDDDDDKGDGDAKG